MARRRRPALSSPALRSHGLRNHGLARPASRWAVTALAATTAVGSAGPALAGGPAGAEAAAPPRVAVATGSGGAVASVDPDATRVGLEVLADGGSAADAAIAAAAALGVTEPYSAGIGGGGFLVHYDADTGEVTTVDGRETAPATFTETVFTDGAGGALDVDTVISSGLSVGVPGTPALWDLVADELGTRPLAELLRPAEELAREGFVVDETYAAQTADNEERFRLFPETARVYLPGGAVPEVGATVTNPDLARAYAELAEDGVDALYRGPVGEALVEAARTPATAPGVSVPGGQLTTDDLRAYAALVREPVRSEYRGLDVLGMPLPSAGGAAVAEALNLLEAYDELTGTGTGDVDEAGYLHRFAEASATAFADRDRWLGDVAGAPADGLASQAFADERACQLFDPAVAQPRPLPPGDPDGSYRPLRDCELPSGAGSAVRDDHGTTHLTVADASGDVVSYTLTIEQTGGSAITVPGYGFLLNNELTDFSSVPVTEGVPDPNLPGPGKRPRSSMAPTIVLDDGRPVLALGSPGGATIITTVAQVLAGHLGRDLPLPEAVAAPRLSSRNGAAAEAEPAIADAPLGAELTARGHVLAPAEEIGATTAVRLLEGGRFEAVAEPTRRGGGSAGVVEPDEG